MKVYIDAGHRNNINDWGATGNNQRESVLALQISKKLRKSLEDHNIICFTSRESENDILTKSERCQRANTLKVDLFVSIHINSFKEEHANGIEVWYYDNKDFAKSICDKMCLHTKATNRGAKQNQSFEVLNSTKMLAVLVECGFISNKDECNKLSNETYQDKLVQGITEAILERFKIVVHQNNTPILSKATATVEQCKEWARSKNATTTFIDNATLYFQICKASGVNPLVAYTQYAKETGYGKFGGVLDESFKNPCGLKIPEGGGCTNPNAHKRFDSWEDGISAHVDHLALYAGADGYPNSSTLDPRHFSYLKGKCKTVESLSGNWAPSQTYGSDIVRMMNEVKKIEILSESTHQENIRILNDAGIITSPKVWEDETKLNITYVPALIKNMANYIRNIKG